MFVCAAAVAVGPGGARSAAVKPSYAGTCGLPNTTPLWIDFGWPDFAQIFGRPGVVVSASSGDFPAQMRQRGAQTVYWDMYLASRVGQPTEPADPGTIADKANRLYDYAAAQIGCTTPVIVENELFGAGLPTPWSETNAVYRQNVLTYLQQLASRGAHPVLLINSDPYTGNDAAAWWQQVASVADIVREAYVPATQLWALGPIVANRTLRMTYRNDIQQLTSIGIVPQRLGLIASMATTKGFGGRNGLQPDSAWYEVVKWQALSLRQVAQETGIATLWSWGWGRWSEPEQDPAKSGAACVWLWARDNSLCDPVAAGVHFNRSLADGQIRLGTDVQCSIGGRGLSNDAIQRLQLVTGDRNTAFTAIFARLVDADAASVQWQRVLAAERAVVATRFGGSWGAYRSALAAAHANQQIARAVLEDELRREKIESRLYVGAPSATAIETFYTSYPDLLARRVQAKPAPSWLGGRVRGLALADIAPDALFRLRGPAVVRTPLGAFRVKPLGDAVSLGSVPLAQARPAIAAALRAFQRGEAYERWSAARQAAALSRTICARDDLPAPGTVELSTYLPFLALAG